MPRNQLALSFVALAVATSIPFFNANGIEPIPVVSKEMRLDYDVLWESYDQKDNKWFAWIRFASNGMVEKLFEADGTPREHVPRSLQHPTWSSDGEKLAYYLDIGDDYMMYEYDVRQKIRSELATGVFPSYAPSGNRLVYSAGSQKTDTTELWIYGKDGSDERVTDLAQGCRWPSWSPDGKRIVFNSFDKTWNLYLLDVKSGAHADFGS